VNPTVENLKLDKRADMRTSLIVLVATLLAACAAVKPGPFIGSWNGVLHECKIHGVPDGYVIVGDASVAGCGSATVNTWMIRRPRDQEAVCDRSPVPKDYREVRKAVLPRCPARELPDGVSVTMQDNGKVISR
jgi:hypothetical protein